MEGQKLRKIEARRKISIRMLIRFSKEQWEKAEEKFTALGVKKGSRSAYVRGLILSSEEQFAKKEQSGASKITEQELYQLNRIGNNLNQIAKRLNSQPVPEVYQTDIELVKMTLNLLNNLINKISESKPW